MVQVAAIVEGCIVHPSRRRRGGRRGRPRRRQHARGLPWHGQRECVQPWRRAREQRRRRFPSLPPLAGECGMDLGLEGLGAFDALSSARPEDPAAWEQQRGRRQRGWEKREVFLSWRQGWRNQGTARVRGG